MASNKRQLQQDKKHLTKAKAPSKPKDVLYTENGQYDFPGEITKVPTPTGRITMAGVNQPLYGVDNTGYAQMMYPENEYQFPGDVVTEYPQEAKRGGTTYELTKPTKKGLNSKKYSRSLMATNRLFLVNPLFKKPKSKKRKIFDPNAKYYQDGGEQDDYVYIDNLSPDEIEEYAKGGYVIEDISIPSLNQYDNGGGIFKRRKKKKQEQVQPEYVEPVEVDDEMYESVTPYTQAPEDFKKGVGNIKEVEKKAQAPDWLNFSREYEKKNSKQAFIDEKKREYLKGTNQGLIKARGYNMENFPPDVERRFGEAYDYKKNSYIVKKLGKKYDFSPNRRGEWVDYLSGKERDIVANSKFESKLQPSLWDRTLAGLTTLTTPFSAQANDAMNKGELPGLTKREQKEIKDAKLLGLPVGGLESLAWWDAPGVAIANALEQSGSSGYGAGYREAPSALSAQPMANVSEIDAMVLNPLNYTLPYDIVAGGASALKGVRNLGKFVKEAPAAINKKLIDNAGRFAKPKFGELPVNLDPTEISRLNQIDEARGIQSYRSPNKPQQIQKFIQNTKLSDDDIVKIFGKTKEELLDVEEVSKKANSLDNQLPPPPETIVIDQPTSNFDGPAYLRRNPGLAEQLRNPAARGADRRIYNLLMETAQTKKKNPLEELIDIPKNVGSMFYSHKHSPSVEAVPGLYATSFENKRQMLEALNKKITEGVENADIGDIITGSTNTSYNSYLPQIDYVFKNAGKEGLSKPVYLGYHPMNASGYLSEHGESLETILDYINNNLNKIQKRSGTNLDLGERKPYIKNNVIFLPHYGLKKTGENVAKIIKEEGGEIILNDLTDDQLKEYLDGGYIVEKIN